MEHVHTAAQDLQQSILDVAWADLFTRLVRNQTMPSPSLCMPVRDTSEAGLTLSITSVFHYIAKMTLPSACVLAASTVDCVHVHCNHEMTTEANSKSEKMTENFKRVFELGCSQIFLLGPF